ncbi:MAG TPA: ATP-dependent 6-phosphofructokinase [Burkholderiaceae bacterium]|nr:ATP-dependent 6-phosphofructokinase [Burkholderiaceae bacterium]
MKRVAVLTSGGDAPGMNAAVRAIVRAGVDRGWTMIGVGHGYSGLLGGDFVELGARDVGGIINRGGTMLGSSRCPSMKTEAGQRQGVDMLARHGVESLIVIGGDGSQKGAFGLATMGARVVGVASTIDNDLFGSEVSIGATTAVDVALEAIDRLRTTAASHERAFLVEVMGRNCGYLGLMAGIAGGAEAIVIPEVQTDPEKIAAELRACRERGKRHAIVVVAEGAPYNAERLSAYFREHGARLGFDLRVTQLGHVQRGGDPGGFDRILATRLGAAAVDCVARGEHGVLMGLLHGKVAATPLAQVVSQKQTLDHDLLALAQLMVR